MTTLLDRLWARLATPRSAPVDEGRRRFVRGLLASSAAVVVAPEVALEAIDALAHAPRPTVDVVATARWLNVKSIGEILRQCYSSEAISAVECAFFGIDRSFGPMLAVLRPRRLAERGRR